MKRNQKSEVRSQKSARSGLSSLTSCLALLLWLSSDLCPLTSVCRAAQVNRIPPTTTYSRGLLIKTTSADSRTYLEIGDGLVYHFNTNNFVVDNDTNISLLPSGGVTNAALTGNTTSQMIDVGATSGTLNVDASLSMEFSVRLTGNMTLGFTNWTAWHPLNLTLTNTGSFALTITNVMFWIPTQNSTQVTNDQGAGVVNVYHFFKATGGQIIASEPERAVTSLSGAGTSGQVAYWNAASSITGDTNFLWSAAGKSLTLLNGTLLLGSATNQLASSSVNLIYSNPGPQPSFRVTNGVGTATFGLNAGNNTFIDSATGFVYLGATLASLGFIPQVFGSYSIGNNSTTGSYLDLFVTGRHVWNGTTNNLIDTWGVGSPEAVVTGRIGSTYRRTDGGAATSFYVKESGTSNTGWVAK